MRATMAAIATCGMAFTAPSIALADGYTLRQVIVHGRVANSVSAMSHGGILGGAFTDPAGKHNGFLLHNGALTVLKGPTKGLYDPLPTDIQDNGLAAGYSYTNTVFWKNGHEQPHDGTFFDNSGIPPFFIGINEHHEIAINTGDGGGNWANFIGKRPPYTQIYPCNSAFIASINEEGVVSGDCLTAVHYPVGETIFTYDHGTITYIFGPGITDAYGGLINDSGLLAGTYYDANDAWHGMIIRNGRYTTFDAPTPPKTMSVTALSNTDIVAGTYVDQSGANHGFTWHKGVFRELVPNPSPTIRVFVVGVSDAGDVALNLDNPKTGGLLPYVAHCKGNAC